MHVDALNVLSALAGAPFLAIVLISIYHQLRKAAWRHNRRLGKKNLGFCPPSIALGMAFQVFQVFYEPSIALVIETKLQEDVEEDDEGDPETPAKQLHRQLKRIRRGEPVDTLVLRL